VQIKEMKTRSVQMTMQRLLSHQGVDASDFNRRPWCSSALSRSISYECAQLWKFAADGRAHRRTVWSDWMGQWDTSKPQSEAVVQASRRVLRSVVRELRTIRADPNFFETGRPGGIEVLEWLRSKNLSSYAPLFAHHDIVCNPTLFSHVMVLRDCIWGTNGFVLKQSRGFDWNHSCGVLITAML